MLARSKKRVRRAKIENKVMLANTIFEDAVEKLFDVTMRFAAALDAAGIPYRVVGGLAVFVHVDARDRSHGRTADQGC